MLPDTQLHVTLCSALEEVRNKFENTSELLSAAGLHVSANCRHDKFNPGVEIAGLDQRNRMHDIQIRETQREIQRLEQELAGDDMDIVSDKIELRMISKTTAAVAISAAKFAYSQVLCQPYSSQL